MNDNIFQSILVQKPRLSRFDLSYDHKLSFKTGKLIPVNVMEALPGDIIKQSSSAMTRMAPMLAPIMHKLDITFHHYFVPYRILWEGWEKFITGGNGTEVPPAMPYMNNSAPTMEVIPSSLPNYLGLPIADFTEPLTPPKISALPFAAYQSIWFEYYRDQNLQFPDYASHIFLPDGELSVEITDYMATLRSVAWGHDYFTSALPFAQKGEAVEFPVELSGDLDVIADHTRGGNPKIVKKSDGSNSTPFTQVDTNAASEMTIDDFLSMYDPSGTMYVDGDGVTTNTTINDLRVAFATQKVLELNARAGSRYKEYLNAHYGTSPTDARLQRPEYLGGSKSAMAISEVLQTSSTDAQSPQGNMAGHGVSINQGQDFSYLCKEHGIVMSMMFVRPRTAYYQGVPKLFTKFDKYDYAHPLMAQLGEQEIKNQEIFLTRDEVIDQGTFGYIPRYAEYRFNNSRVSGQMATTYDFWHMGRKFNTLPTLNYEFIVCRPTKRIYAVTTPSVDELTAHVYHSIDAVRPLPKYGIPTGL